MAKNKLFALLEHFTVHERSKMIRLLRNHPSQTRKEAAGLLQALSEGEPDREVLFARVWPGEPYRDIRLRRLQSELMRYVEDFLVEEELAERAKTRQRLLLAGLRKRKAVKYQNFIWRKFSRKDELGPYSPDLLLEDHLLHAEQNDWIMQQRIRSSRTHLGPTVESLDAFYIYSKLRYTCMSISNRRVVDSHFEPILFDAILQYIDEENAEGFHPGIALYYRIYLMLTEEDPEPHYQQLKHLLSFMAKYFVSSESHTMYAFALNHCVRHINRGDEGFLEEVFDLYKNGLSDESLLDNGQLSPWNYKNMVTAGLRLGEYGWVDNFLHEFRERVPSEFRENAFTYNLARLEFYRKRYRNVLKMLNQVEYEDIFYNLDSKAMLLKVYFEEGEIEALDSLLDTFQIYLRRNKLISSEHRRNYLNFIRFVRKLSRLVPGTKLYTLRLNKILEDINATDHIADRNWLLDKSQEMRGEGNEIV